MSKVVKECPADPIEFLIGKLQAIQRQRRKVSHIRDYMQAFFVHWWGRGQVEEKIIEYWYVDVWYMYIL